jgi:hypothetical protein
MRPLLSEQIPLPAKAQKLLDERRREVLKTKVLTLGEGLFSESGAAEAERKLVLETLDKELDVLAEQKKLLGELKGLTSRREAVPSDGHHGSPLPALRCPA